MAIGKKTGGRNFEPGQTGNPSGSSAIARELGNARKLNQIEVTEMLNRFAQMPVSEIVAHSKNQLNDGLSVLVSTIFIKAINTGDHARLGFILDRLIGKVKEVHEHTFLGNVNAAIVDKIAEIEKSNATGGNNNAEKSSAQEIGQKTTKKEVDSDESF